MQGKCRLCQSSATLRRSHILPEFLYKPAYDRIHRAIEQATAKGRDRFLQKGYREHLLCDACEQHIGRFEDYFAREWYEQGRLPSSLNDAVVTMPGLDYKLFRLFHLSIVWRAGVSQRDEFRNVKLGPHERIIREMLLNADPGDPKTYPVWGRILFDPADRRVTDDIILEPSRQRVDAHHVYVFVFGGCLWYYVVSSHPEGAPVPEYFEQGGTLHLVAQDLFSVDHLRDFADRYKTVRRT